MDNKRDTNKNYIYNNPLNIFYIYNKNNNSFFSFGSFLFFFAFFSFGLVPIGKNRRQYPCHGRSSLSKKSIPPLLLLNCHKPASSQRSCPKKNQKKLEKIPIFFSNKC